MPPKLKVYTINSEQIFPCPPPFKHFQRLSTASLKAWIATRQSGKILCAHCTCMAGKGETCSCIAALLFGAKAHFQLV